MKKIILLLFVIISLGSCVVRPIGVSNVNYHKRYWYKPWYGPGHYNNHYPRPRHH
jgi:hypothetical protein